MFVRRLFPPIIVAALTFLVVLTVIIQSSSVSWLPTDSVVRIKSTEVNHASGFIVSEQIVLTNAHVARRAEDKTVVVETRDGGVLDGTVIYQDDTRDLALIWVAGVGHLPSLAIVCERPERGSSITAIGHPLVTVWAEHRGFVAASRPPLFDARFNLPDFVVMDIGLSPGMSGSPVLDDKGRVVGVATGVVLNPQGSYARTSHSGLAVPGDILCDFLENAGLR